MNEEIRQAFEDWNSGRACLGNDGNYRFRTKQTLNALGLQYVGSGKIAPWNKTIKKLFPSNEDFHDAAEEFHEGERTMNDHWKLVSAYLADCHAANCEYFVSLKSTSNRNKERFRSIAEKALRYLKEEDTPNSRRTLEDVIERLVETQR